MMDSSGFWSRNGFTLIEVALVLTMLGIVVAMAAPRIDIWRFRADAAQRIVQNALVQGQRTAVLRQHDVVVAFDTGTGRISVLHDLDNNRTADPGETLVVTGLESGNRFQAPPVGLSGSAVPAVYASRVFMLGTLPAIVFHRNGAAGGDLELYLTSSRDNPEHFRALSVVRATGRAQLFRYAGSQWMPVGM